MIAIETGHPEAGAFAPAGRLVGHEAHGAHMSALAALHGPISDLIGERPFHYVDIPVHGNIGDLLIFLGTLAFFRNRGLVPKIVAPAFAWRQQWVGSRDVIVFHGGGNFGDLYSGSGSHALREAVAEGLPGNPIIVLPQTFHFSSASQRNRSARIFRRHPDLHLCVRDKSSYEMASQFSEHVYLLPDMAHNLYPVRSQRGTGGAGTLLLSRTDNEKSAAAARLDSEFSVTSDWPQLVGVREHRIDQFRRAMRKAGRVGVARPMNKVIARAWSAYSALLVADAIDLFASHDHIVTDRLHGHILACLMNKPSTVVDNSYGKNFGYVDAWTAGSALVTLQNR